MYTSADEMVITGSNEQNNGNIESSSPSGAVRRVCISKNVEDSTQLQNPIQMSNNTTPEFKSGSSYANSQSVLLKLRED